MSVDDHCEFLLPELPPNTKPLEHQVAGHFYGLSKTKFGLLQRSNGDVLKPLLNPPRGPREYRFYVDVFQNTSSSSYSEQDLLNIRNFLPKYLGTYEFKNMTYLILENIIQPFELPCIADIKIGRITYDPEADLDKIERQAKKFPPAAEVGFQLLGWKTYRQREQVYEYHDKHCGRTLDKDELIHAIAHFYGATTILRRDVIKQVLNRLLDLELIMDKQRTLLLFASSLLIVYDGKQSIEPHTDVRLVDFAHVFPNKKHDENDENFLFGIRNYINYLILLLDENYVYIPVTKIEHHPKKFSCYKQSSHISDETLTDTYNSHGYTENV